MKNLYISYKFYLAMLVTGMLLVAPTSISAQTVVPGLGTYTGSGTTGFGGIIGNSTLQLQDNGRTIIGSLQRTGTPFNFNNNALVIYISNGDAGRAQIDAEVNDVGSRLRDSISYITADLGGSAPALTFPAGFEATHAIAIDGITGALFEIPPTGEVGENDLIEIGGVNVSGQGFNTLNFSFDISDINSVPGGVINFVATYIDHSGGSAFGFRGNVSNEGYGESFPSDAQGNIGQNNFTFTNALEYIISGASTINDGTWTQADIWNTGTPPVNDGAVLIRHSVELTSSAPELVVLDDLTITGENAILNLQRAEPIRFDINQNGAFRIRNNGNFIQGDAVIRFKGNNSVDSDGVIDFSEVEIEGAVNFGVDVSRIVGTLRIMPNGFVNANPPEYLENSTLLFDTGANGYNVTNADVTWPASITRAPYNVVVRNTEVSFVATNIDRSVKGSLSVEAGAVFALSNSSSFDLNIGGDFVMDGQFFALNGGLLFDGDGDQNLIHSLNNPLQVVFLGVDKTAGTLFLQNDVDLFRTLRLFDGTMDVNNATLRLRSAGTSNRSRISGTGNGTIAGEFITQHHLAGNAPAGSGSFRFLATGLDQSLADHQNAPGSGAPLLSNIWTQGAAGANATNGIPNVWDFDESAVITDNGDVTGGYTGVTDLTNPMLPGSGRLVYVFTNDLRSVPGSWPKVLNTTASFNSFENDGSVVNMPVSFTNDARDAAAKGWNLVGNPFVSSISWNSPDFQRTNMSNTYYVIRSNGNVASFNGTTGVNGATHVISAFQGFLVQAIDENPVMTVTAEAKVNDIGTYLFRGEPDYRSIRIRLANEDLDDEMAVVFHENGSETLSIMDAYQLWPFNDTYTMISTAKSASDKLLSIASLPFDLVDTVMMPISVSVPFSGYYDLEVSELINVPVNWMVELVNASTGERVELEDGMVKSIYFESAGIQPNGSEMGGFLTASLNNESISQEWQLVISPEGSSTSAPVNPELPRELTLSQNYPNPFNPTTQINFTLPESAEVSLDVFNLQGQRVAMLVNATRAAGSHTITFDGSRL
ncbi:MAG: hypothetical protein LAT67_13145, partial [Balneolales bacterium]|nr:hypothetical protein [Balneolales bacterium]